MTISLKRDGAAAAFAVAVAAATVAAGGTEYRV